MPAEPYLGQIMPVGFPFAPKGWAACNGQLLAINQNQALFTLLGTAFGGDGRATFALPDLRGRAALGCNFGSIPQGQIAGSEKVTMTVDQLPNHIHTLQGSTTPGTLRSVVPTSHLFGVNTSPVASIFAVAGSREIPLAVGANVAPSGGNQAHNNMQPYLVINYLIATSGAYPSRS
ncbi:MAG: phenylacrylic acid decarboxylase [Tardiphaga sp.]|jgi:microcystin-dependent protein|nr:phenylacrylic acid decarboxylase [Tardiphaga sp.]